MMAHTFQGTLGSAAGFDRLLRPVVVAVSVSATADKTMKSVTVIMHPADRRQTEVRWLLEKRFPQITKVEFREDDLATIPRTMHDGNEDGAEEIIGVDAALLSHFGV